MTVFCLGSINVDHVYRVPTLPRAGETLTAVSHSAGLGGKGVNQSVAALRSGARVVHIGAVGEEDRWIEAELARHGVETGFIARVSQDTGHALVAVDDAGENQIIVFPGANVAQDPGLIDAALATGKPGDILLLQNETSRQVEAAQRARARGMRVFYSAAPFAVQPLLAVLPHATHLLMNTGEAAALVAATATALADLPVEAVIVTHGARGAEWISAGSEPLFVSALRVEPIDTTGAGDCFAGNLAGRLDQGAGPQEAMALAAAAAAIQVTRPGAAAAMPTQAEVAAFLAAR